MARRSPQVLFTNFFSSTRRRSPARIAFPSRSHPNSRSSPYKTFKFIGLARTLHWKDTSRMSIEGRLRILWNLPGSFWIGAVGGAVCGRLIHWIFHRPGRACTGRTCRHLSLAALILGGIFRVAFSELLWCPSLV